ncbi:MAG: hypothetical protein ACYDBJ_18270 [Aggregatilineales bacterium]
MAQNAARLEDIMPLALNLSARDRLKLVEQLVSSVEHEMGTDQPRAANATPGHWGAEVIALLDQLDLSEWQQMDIPDVGEWVHQLRHEESEHHRPSWKKRRKIRHSVSVEVIVWRIRAY